MYLYAQQNEQQHRQVWMVSSRSVPNLQGRMEAKYPRDLKNQQVQVARFPQSRACQELQCLTGTAEVVGNSTCARTMTAGKEAVHIST
jgi:hypothetical protein